MSRGVFPPCCLTWGQTMVELVKKISTSFKRSHATLSVPDPAAGHHRPTPPSVTPGHSRASLGQSLVGSLLLSPGSLCAQGFFFFFNFILFLNFTILYWFCQISKWIHHRYTCVPHPDPPPSSLPIPSLWVIPVHQLQASSIVHWTWTGDSFHIWYYTYFNDILPNHPTLSLSHRVQKSVLYISVSFAVSYTGLLLPSF